jgi:hypothetical protein
MPILGSHLNFAQLEARNAVVHNLSTAPAAPVKGQLYFDTVSNALFFWSGTAWVSTAGGTPPDATASTKGVVQLAGDLSGTAAAPTVAASAITSAKIADGTITDGDVAGANKDGAVGLASMRTLGLGAQQAMPGNERLDQITAPTAPVSLNGQRITNQADPTSAQDSATKNYVDNVATGLDAKQSVKAASTGNLSLTGTQTVDTIALVAGDRVLVKDQTTASANGIYVVASGAWTRAVDMDAWTEVPGAYTWVEQGGSVNADSGWVCTADQGGTLGTTSITWSKFSSAPSSQVGYYSNAATHGAGTTITIAQTTHGLRASRGIHVQVQDNTTGTVELPDVSVAAGGDVTVTYAASVAANSKLVTLVG